MIMSFETISAPFRQGEHGAIHPRSTVRMMGRLHELDATGLVSDKANPGATVVTQLLLHKDDAIGQWARVDAVSRDPNVSTRISGASVFDTLAIVDEEVILWKAANSTGGYVIYQNDPLRMDAARRNFHMHWSKGHQWPVVWGLVR